VGLCNIYTSTYMYMLQHTAAHCNAFVRILLSTAGGVSSEKMHQVLVQMMVNQILDAHVSSTSPDELMRFESNRQEESKQTPRTDLEMRQVRMRQRLRPSVPPTRVYRTRRWAKITLGKGTTSGALAPRRTGCSFAIASRLATSRGRA